MEIILKAEVEHLGEKDDLVKVKNGYALNYLIPKGYAVLATESAKKMHAENLKQASRRLNRIKEEAQKQAASLAELKLSIPTLVGKEGKIYGSITPLQIHNALAASGFELDRRKIVIKDEITALGKYIAYITLHKEVKVELPFEVVEKQAE